MTFQIRQDVPLPEGARNRYPFGQLQVGDSFFVPDRTATSLRASAATYRKKNEGWNFTVRDAEVDGTTGALIWRTA
jgi:hypothetical protein